MLYCNTCGCLFEPTKGIEEHNCMACCRQHFLEVVKKHKDETKQLEDIAVGPIPTEGVFWLVYYAMVEVGYKKSEETEHEKFFENGYLCASCPQLGEYDIVYCLEEEIMKARIVDPYEYLGSAFIASHSKEGSWTQAMPGQSGDKINILPDIAVGPIDCRSEFHSVLPILKLKGYEVGELQMKHITNRPSLSLDPFDATSSFILAQQGEQCRLARILPGNCTCTSVHEFVWGVDKESFDKAYDNVIEKLAEEKEPPEIGSSLRGCVQDTSTEEECQAPASKQVTIGTGSDAPASIHYRGDVEPIDLIDAQGFGIGFCAGNAIKYLSRFDKKGTAILDIEKAIWYAEHLLKLLKEGQDE